MAEFTERHAEMLQETRDAMLEMKTVILGKNGDKGMVGKLNDVCESHYSFKERIYLVAGILVGLGVLGGGGYGLAQLLIKGGS